MEEKELQTNEQSVKTKKKMNPKKKKITIASIVIGIIAIIAILIGVNHTQIMSDLTYSMMPKSLTPVVDGQEVTFFVYKNRDFNQFKDKKTPLMEYKRSIFNNYVLERFSIDCKILLFFLA